VTRGSIWASCPGQRRQVVRSERAATSVSVGSLPIQLGCSRRAIGHDHFGGRIVVSVVVAPFRQSRFGSQFLTRLNEVLPEPWGVVNPQLSFLLQIGGRNSATGGLFVGQGHSRSGRHNSWGPARQGGRCRSRSSRERSQALKSSDSEFQHSCVDHGRTLSDLLANLVISNG
jgi:hypothetical protein